MRCLQIIKFATREVYLSEGYPTIETTFGKLFSHRRNTLDDNIIYYIIIITVVPLQILNNTCL